MSALKFTAGADDIHDNENHSGHVTRELVAVAM